MADYIKIRRLLLPLKMAISYGFLGLMIALELFRRTIKMKTTQILPLLLHHPAETRGWF